MVYEVEAKVEKVVTIHDWLVGPQRPSERWRFSDHEVIVAGHPGELQGCRWCKASLEGHPVSGK